MSIDPSNELAAASSGARRRMSGRMMMAGVAGAGVLGAALGLWARPSDVEHELTARHLPRRPAAPAAETRRIEIRVARPTPHAGPAAPVAAQPLAPAPAIEAEPLAPRRPPEGLMRVHAVAPLKLDDPRPSIMRALPERRGPSAAKLEAEAKARSQAAQAQRAKAVAARKAEIERRDALEAEAHRRAEKIAKARVAKAEAKDAARRKAAARGMAEARAQAKALKRKLIAEQARAEAVRLAEARAKRARAEAARREALAAAAAKAQRAEAARRAGPLRKASLRCALPDAGAALTCADPALGSAERQLSRAYREAQAAGVPASTLERQQQRWIAARATAAREAPWAVHDVYLARIAELKDQTRQASRGD